LSYCCPLGWICREAWDYQMWRMVQRKVSWMLTATSGYIIGPHGLIYDLFMTTQHVIWLQSWINALWTLKTVYFLIYSYFFFASERCRRKTIRKGRTKWWCSPIDTSTRCIAIKIIRLPNFGAKRLHTDVWSSFAVQHFSMIIDVYTSFCSEVEDD
jgi:hypothetical protein